MDLSSIGQHYVKSHDMIESKSPFSGVISITSMKGVACNANTRASAMRKCSLALVVNGLSYITQSLARSNFGYEYSWNFVSAGLPKTFGTFQHSLWSTFIDENFSMSTIKLPF